MNWTDEKIEQVKKLWPTHSASEIGRIMNCSRSAIAGKMHRLGVSKGRPKEKFQRSLPHPRPLNPRPKNGGYQGGDTYG